MAIAYGGVSAQVTSTTGTVTPTLPTGTVEGDLLIFHVGHGSGSTVMPTPAGWNLGTSIAISTTHRNHLFWRFAEAGETNPTFTSSITTNGMWGRLTRWTGVPVSADPFNFDPTGATGTGNQMAGASMTPTVTGAMAVWFWLQSDNGTTSTADNSATVAYSGTSSSVGIDADLSCAYKLMPTATATGVTSMTSSTSVANACIRLVLDPTPVIKSGGDTGTGSESGGVVATAAGGDTGTGTDFGEAGELKGGGDSGTGSESYELTQIYTGSDSATGTESLSSLIGSPVGGDTAAGTETGNTTADVTGSDSGAGSESGHIMIPGGDSGTGTDALVEPLFATVTNGDSGTGSEGGYVETLWGDLVLAIWGIDPADGHLVPLPDFASFTASRERNAQGSIGITYPVDGLNFDFLRSTVTSDRDLEIEIWWIGNDTGATRGFLQEASGDDVKDDRTWEFAGAFGEVLVGEAVAYPSEIITTVVVTTTVKVDDTHYTVTKRTTVSSPSSPAVTTTTVTTVSSGNEGTTTETSQTNGDLIFTDVTPGEMMVELVDQAQDRGTLLDLELGFTATHDSAGRPWDKTITTKFSPGSTYQSILQRFVDFAMSEWAVEWTGTAYRLQMWAPEGRGVDRTQGLRPTILRKARNLIDAPRKWSVRDSGTTILAAGAEGIYKDATDLDAVTRRGRKIERSVSANNLADPEVVMGYAQNQLRLISEGTLEVTHGIAFLPGEPRPVIAFDIGDWVFSQTAFGLEKLRVVQWTITYDPTTRSGTVTLNDTMTDALSRLKAQLLALTSGDTVVGTSESSGSQDLGVPMPPEITGATSTAFLDGTRGVRAAVEVAWIPPSVNTDGSVITDLSGYTVQFAMASSPDAFNVAATVNNPGADSAVFDAPADQTILIRVRAFDQHGNTSDWSAPPYPYTTAADDVPPPVPSGAVVSDYLGTVRITWDGLTADGTNMRVSTLDFDHVEVHMSTGSLFTPSDATLLGFLYDRGSMVQTDLPYAVTQYARFVAVDWSGNKSAPSAQGSATPAPVVSADIFDGAVGTAKLADAAITTAKINDLAVNNAKIGDLSVGKLTSGTMSAAVLLAGSIKTDTVGTRVEIGSFGIKLFNGTNTMVDLNTTTGSALVVGEFRTALTGQRVVHNPGGALPDTMNFYPNGSGDFARIMARTAPNDGTAAILIDGGAANGTARGRIGAYKSECFISHVKNDSGGDTSAGFSTTAVSCTPTRVNAWCTDQFYFWKINSSGDQIGGSLMGLFWASGDSGQAPCITANNAGIKMDGGFLVAVNGTGTSIGNFKCNGFSSPSSITVKQDVTMIGDVLNPVSVIAAAPSMAWRYRAEVAEYGTAPLRFGPVTEDLHPLLTRDVPSDIPGKPEKAIDLGSMVGLLWGASGQLIERVEALETALRRIHHQKGNK